MKPTAEIKKFYGKELRTEADMTEAMEALMADLNAGNVSPAEAKKIQREINALIKKLAAERVAGIKILAAWQKFDSDLATGKKQLIKAFARKTKKKRK